MGIREFFQENPPGEKDLNIHNLAIEKDKKEREELPFDSETEIFNSDWQGMRNNLESSRQQSGADPFSGQAMYMKILFPEKTAELGLDDEAWRKMKFSLVSWREQKNWINFSHQAMAMKIIFPERTAELGLDDEAWQGIDKDTNRPSLPKHTNYTAMLTMEMKILFPKKTAKLNLDDKVYQGKKWKLTEGVRWTLKDLRQKKQWENFSMGAMYMKILFPEKTAELGLDDEAWQGMKTELENFRRQKSWGEFSQQAAAMKILVAYKVEVTDEGLEITMRKPEPFRPEKKIPRPERRQF